MPIARYPPRLHIVVCCESDFALYVYMPEAWPIRYHHARRRGIVVRAGMSFGASAEIGANVCSARQLTREAGGGMS